MDEKFTIANTLAFRQLPDDAQPCPQSSTILPELSDFHELDGFLELCVREAVRDDRRNVEATLDHRCHFVPGCIHLAAVNAIDCKRTENDPVPIDGGAARHESADATTENRISCDRVCPRRDAHGVRWQRVEPIVIRPKLWTNARALNALRSQGVAT